MTTEDGVVEFDVLTDIATIQHDSETMSADVAALQLNVEMQRLIALRKAGLRAIPDKWGSPPQEMIALLPKGGDKDKNTWARCTNPRCKGWHAKNAAHLDYMGHADVTLALIDIDPLWNWEPLAYEAGLPAVTIVGGIATLWIRLTILGVSRIGCGTCATGKEDLFKELYGDAIRNAAMRFGIATKLWSKTEGVPETEDRPTAVPPRAAATAPVSPPASVERSGESAPVAVGSPEFEAARQRGQARADAAVAGQPDPHPTSPDDAQQVALPAEVLRRMDLLIAATPELNTGQRTVQLVRIARRHQRPAADVTAMVADDETWRAVCAAIEINDPDRSAEDT